MNEHPTLDHRGWICKHKSREPLVECLKGDSRLESRERLSRLAAKLGMREAGTFAEVALPAPAQPPQPSGIALLSWLK